MVLTAPQATNSVRRSLLLQSSLTAPMQYTMASGWAEGSRLSRTSNSGPDRREQPGTLLLDHMLLLLCAYIHELSYINTQHMCAYSYYKCKISLDTANRT